MAWKYEAGKGFSFIGDDPKDKTIVKDRFAIPQNQGASTSAGLAAKARDGKDKVEASKLYSGSVATEGMMLKGKARRDRQLMKDQFKDFKRRGIEDHPEAIKSQFAGTGETGRLDVKNLKLQDKLNRKAQQIQQKREGDKLSFKEKQKLRKDMHIQQEKGGYGSFKPEDKFKESTKKVVKPEDWKTSRYGWIPGEKVDSPQPDPTKPDPTKPGVGSILNDPDTEYEIDDLLAPGLETRVTKEDIADLEMTIPKIMPTKDKTKSSTVNKKQIKTHPGGSVTDKPKNNTSADKIKTTSGTTQYQDIGVTPSESIQNKQLVDNPQTQRTENGLNITHYGGDADGDYVGPDQRELAEKQGYDVQQEKWSDDTIHYRIFKK